MITQRRQTYASLILMSNSQLSSWNIAWMGGWGGALQCVVKIYNMVATSELDKTD